MFNWLDFPEFSRVCEQSTDFHFPDLQQQLTTIEQQLPVVKDMSSKKDNSSKDSKVLDQEYFTHKTVKKSMSCKLCSDRIHYTE